MEGLLNAIRREVARALNRAPKARLGVVTSMDPAGPRVKVRFDEEGLETGWLAVASQQAGNGWGIHAPPVPGTQVLVQPVDGAFGVGVVVGSIWSRADQPGQAPAQIGGGATQIQGGEIGLIHSSGAVIRLAADGTIFSSGTWNHDGDFLASGSVSDLNGLHGTVGALRTAYDAHRHPGVQAGGASTGTTDEPV